jgi:moderate conductance mechanosensitive channel
MDQASLDAFIQAFVIPFFTIRVPQILGAVIGALAVLVIGNWVLGITTRAAISGARKAHMKPALVDLLTAGVTAAGWVLIAAGVLQALNLNELAIAVGGSISLVALGIATAASGNLGDIIAGVFLASDPDFGNGFTIKTGEITGTIERIDLRKTRVRTEDGKLHIIPNKSIESSVWIVEKRPAPPAPVQGSGPRLQLPFQRGQRPQNPQPPQPNQPTPGNPSGTD